MTGDGSAAAGRGRPRGAWVVTGRVVVLVALVSCFVRGGARAQSGPSAGPAGRAARTASSPPDPGAGVRSTGAPLVGTVEFTVVGTNADLQRLRRGVASRTLTSGGTRWTHVARFDPMWILRGDRDSQTATLRCWIDMVDPRRARLYFAARSGQQFLVREVELSGAFDAVDREALSQVIELSVSALLENERAGLTRAQTEALLASREPPTAARPVRAPAAPAPSPTATATPTATGTATPTPSPTPPPTPSPTPSPSPVLSPPAPAPVPPIAPPSVVEEAGPPPAVDSGPGVGVFYRGQALGSDLPLVHGPGVLLASGGVAMNGRLGGWLSAQYQLPLEEAGRDIGVRLQTVALRAGPTVHRPILRSAGAGGRGLSLAGVTGRAGVGADLVRVTPRPGTADPSAALTPARWSQSLVLTAAAGVSWAAGRHMTVGLFLAVDLLPTAVHYDLNSGGRTAAAFSPWRARPGLALELSLR